MTGGELLVLLALGAWVYFGVLVFTDLLFSALDGDEQ